MSVTRKKELSIVYNGIEIWKQLDPYLQKLSYTDAVDESDKISLTVNDRDLKWINSWMPQKGDVILPAITLTDWNYEGERVTIDCGSFIVDDFNFSCPPLTGNINGVSAPVDSGFKETENTRTWEAATLKLVASEIAGKYGLTLFYEASGDIQIAKTEQEKQTDSDFLKKLCEKYGLGLKVYSKRLVLWDFKEYSAKAPVTILTPSMVTKWNYKSTMQGTYTGAKVSYTDPNTKKTIDIIVGTENRLYKTTQKADSEADARLIGESAVRNANRKETTMQITLPPRLELMAAETIQLTDFGTMDGKYFIERVSHSIGRGAYNMQLQLSRIPDGAEKPVDSGAAGEKTQKDYTVKNGDTLWNLAKQFYGDSSKYLDIYTANQEAIESDAKRHGKGSSNQGYWIWPGLTITIP